MKQFFSLLFVCSLILISCNKEPEPIQYNHDECAFCKMKISDVRFGAELVTNKGKIYKYDSAECLVRTCIVNDISDYAFIIVTDYNRPHTFIDAATAFFFISENQVSPMGGNLSAYEFKDQANKVLEEKGGRLLTFNELLDEYRAVYK